MTSKLHIHGLIPGSSIGLMPVNSLDNTGHASEVIFAERCFWWTLTKEVDFVGDALLRVRCGRTAPYLPFETTITLDENEETSVSVLKVRDNKLDVDDVDKPAPEDFTNAMVQWAKETYKRKTHAQDSIVVIEGVGIIKCWIGEVEVYNQSLDPATKCEWEDPEFFDQIMEALNG